MNRTIYAKDCLDVLNDPEALPNESVDLIYLDPPYNSKSNYNLPFKGEYKQDAKPVMAFKDTWSWSDGEEEILSQLKSGGGGTIDHLLADIVDLSRKVFKEKPNSAISTSAYLLNMAVRLKLMRRVLKDTGSIYLHCDPTAGHYLKMIMDVIFGSNNFKSFRNEIIWFYKDSPGRPQRDFPRKHDLIFRYVRSKNYKFNDSDIRVPILKASQERYKSARNLGGKSYLGGMSSSIGKIPEDVWEIPVVKQNSKQALGYPTQKPLDLLRRIVKVSSNEEDVVFDPFCGCGTTLHAAEELKRKWIGIDISQFSAGLVRKRLLDNFPQLNRSNIPIIGCPLNLVEAEELARTDPFEFEKWVCGEVGAHGLFHKPGERGADGGVDGVIPFYYGQLFDEKPPEKTYAIVQVKGGKVHPDSVKALSATIRQSGAKCGVFICFERYMETVERNREKKRIKDMTGEFNFIQGLSVERLIEGDMPVIPGYMRVT